MREGSRSDCPSVPLKASHAFACIQVPEMCHFVSATCHQVLSIRRKGCEVNIAPVLSSLEAGSQVILPSLDAKLPNMNLPIPSACGDASGITSKCSIINPFVMGKRRSALSSLCVPHLGSPVFRCRHNTWDRSPQQQHFSSIIEETSLCHALRILQSSTFNNEVESPWLRKLLSQSLLQAPHLVMLRNTYARQHSLTGEGPSSTDFKVNRLGATICWVPSPWRAITLCSTEIISACRGTSRVQQILHAWQC
mmetsp:Transcript_19488/g.45328  ORF Transcript_19488/g.45328 Transcript_19488/m.45328 type:complete len:251 (+) Transcript_19488:536-1288(+)